MPDLGQYAPFVLSAWGVTVVALALLTGYVVVDGRRLRRRLSDLEARTGRGERAGGGEA